MSDTNELKFADLQRISSGGYAAGAVLVLVVVYLHIAVGFGYFDRQLIRFPVEVFGFFMTWFYFKSGCYYHSERSFLKTIAKEYKKLLVPYLIFVSLGLLVYNGLELFQLSVIKRVVSQFLDFGSVSEQAPLWFLLDFYIVKIVATYLLHLTKKEIIIICSFLITCILQYATTLPPLISRIPLGIFFYSLGYTLKDIQYDKYVFVICFVAYLMFEATTNCIFDYRVNSSSHYVLILLFCVTGIISLNNIVVRIKLLCDNSVLLYIGKNAMIIYVLHWFYIITMGMDFGIPLSCLTRVTITIILMTTTLPFFIYLFSRKKMKWIMGN